MKKLLSLLSVYLFIPVLGFLPVNTHATLNSLIGIKLIESGATHNILVTNNDEIFTFGNRSNGNLGDDSIENNVAGFSRITDLGDLANKDDLDSILKVKVGINTTHILTETGNLYMFGQNNLGQLGIGSTTNALLPVLMNGFGDLPTIDNDDRIIDVATSVAGFGNTTHVLTEKGRIFGWGINAFYGAVGNDSSSVVTTPLEITTNGEFANFQPNEKVIQIENTRGAVFALTNQNRVFAWGYNYNNTVIPFPQPVVGEAKLPKQLSTSRGVFSTFAQNNEVIVEILGGSFTAAFRTNLDNIVFTGITAYTSVTEPIYLENFPNFTALNQDEKFVNYFPTNEGFFAITNQSRLFAQGRNDSGVGYLGTNNATRAITPVDITANGALADIDVQTIQHITSYSTTFALTENGDLLGWGSNSKGEYLGDITTTATNTPLLFNDLYQQQIVNTLYTPDELVVAAINTIPAINELTFDDEATIEAIRQQYDNLTTEQQALVTNYQILLDAEAKIALLKQQLIDQTAADEVIALIDAFPELNGLTLEEEDQVEAARTAYDDLTVDQKALVTNYQELLDAEAKLALLRQQVIDQAAAQVVIDQIAALPSVDALTLEDTEAVEAARLAYDALTPAQQSFVTNYQTLLDLEAQLLVLSNGFELTEPMWILIAALAGAITALLFWIFFKDRSKEQKLVVAQPTPVKVAKPVSKPVEVKVVPKKVEKPVQAQVVQPTITTIQLDEVVLPNFETRPVLKPLSKVNPGHYLEVTKEKESTNRVVEVKDALPEALDDSNAFVSITKEEVNLVKLSLASTANFVKKTPGSFVDPGYYVEVNLKDEIVDNYILAKKRLPPSSAKGHRWIRIEKRAIRSKK